MTLAAAAEFAIMTCEVVPEHAATSAPSKLSERELVALVAQGNTDA